MGFPKIDCCCTVTADELNYMYDPYDIKASMLENAVNVAKLNYCYSVAEIEHDYMVVDVFTDSGGYNNTVCTADTTSGFFSSGLSGYYSQGTAYLPTACLLSGVCCYGYGNYYVCAKGNAGSYWGNARICVCAEPFTWADAKNIYFNICYYGFCDPDGGNSIGITTNWDDNKNITNACQLFCYRYECVSENCYNFYCNGTCKCQLCKTSFPNIVMCACTENSMSGQTPCVCIYLSELFYSIDSNYKINLVPIQYAVQISTIYLTLDKTGTGTVVYDVYDAETDCQIGCNLSPNNTQLLDCAVQCHRYEIIQCSDGVSCIKSYAILAGKC